MQMETLRADNRPEITNTTLKPNTLIEVETEKALLQGPSRRLKEMAKTYGDAQEGN